MIGWLRALFRRDEPAPEPPPDVDAFLARQREARAEAVQAQRASRRTTRQLQAHWYEQELLSRGEGSDDARRD